jgi:hypothetical protein
VSDLIRPPVARRPEEALELVSQALSDGDLEAALAQYEKGALLAYWPQCWPRGDNPPGPPRQGRPPGDDPPGTPRKTRYHDNGNEDVGQALASFMALRLPLSVRITTVLESPELALVICERRVAGTGPDGEQIRLTGQGCAVLRPQPDGAWRIAADAWSVGTGLPLDPPEIPPAAAGDPVRCEGQGRPPHHLKPGHDHHQRRERPRRPGRVLRRLGRQHRRDARPARA